jgi:hypothetical protein
LENLGGDKLDLKSSESDQLKVENLGSGGYVSGIEISGRIQLCYSIEIHRANQFT